MKGMDIKEAKSNNTSEESVDNLRNKGKQKFWIGGYVLLAVLCLTAYFLFRSKVIDIAARYQVLLVKLLLAGTIVFAVLIISRFLQGVIARRSHTKAIRYNLIRLVRLIVIVIIAFIFITFLNANWYTAAVSLGLISLLLGFALQTPSHR